MVVLAQRRPHRQRAAVFKTDDEGFDSPAPPTKRPKRSFNFISQCAISVVPRHTRDHGTYAIVYVDHKSGNSRLYMGHIWLEETLQRRTASR